MSTLNPTATAASSTIPSTTVSNGPTAESPTGKSATGKSATAKSVPGSRFWNWYAKFYGNVERLVPHQTMIQDLIGLIPADANRILDVGCGSGQLLANLRQQRPDAALYGIDYSEVMLAKATNRVTELHASKADLNQRLPFPDDHFDCLVSSNVIYAVTDPAALAAEMRRVTRPGGRVIVSSPKRIASGRRILISHCRSVGVVRGAFDLANFSVCMLPNMLIERLGKGRGYHFMKKQQVQSLSPGCKIYPDTFAGQNWLFTLVD